MLLSKRSFILGQIFLLVLIYYIITYTSLNTFGRIDTKNNNTNHNMNHYLIINLLIKKIIHWRFDIYKKHPPHNFLFKQLQNKQMNG